MKNFCLEILIFLQLLTSSLQQSFTIRNANVYSPSFLGKSDITIGGNKIISLTSSPHNAHVNTTLANDCSILGIPYGIQIDAKGGMVIPGFIDMHAHVTGGGGEKGPTSRTLEAQVSELIQGGVTTLVGILGTDSVSRSQENLLVKLLALEEDGLTTLMWTGSYSIPVKTLLGNIQKDVILIEKVIGIGEIAISDHRSSYPSFDEFVRIVSDTRIGGMLSGKAGKVYVHMGSGKMGLDPLWEIVNQTDIPITQFIPTHLSSRGQNLIDASKAWAFAGGNTDFTADSGSETDTFQALSQFISENIPLDHVTVSSDAYGSLPVFNQDGKLISYTYQKPNVLLKNFKALSARFGVQTILPFFTKNVAEVLQLKNKGELKQGNDADLLILDQNFNLQYVISSGQILLAGECVKTGLFPCDPLNK